MLEAKHRYKNAQKQTFRKPNKTRLPLRHSQNQRREIREKITNTNQAIRQYKNHDIQHMVRRTQ